MRTYSLPVVIAPTPSAAPLMRIPGPLWAVQILDTYDFGADRFLAFLPDDESDWQEVTPGGWQVIETPETGNVPREVIESARDAKFYP